MNFDCARSRLMSPLIELWSATKLCGRKHDPRALVHKGAPRKADTKSIGHILCSGEHPECHCLSLSGQQIMKRIRRTFSANS